MRAYAVEERKVWLEGRVRAQVVRSFPDATITVIPTDLPPKTGSQMKSIGDSKPSTYASVVAHGLQVVAGEDSTRINLPQISPPRKEDPKKSKRFRRRRPAMVGPKKRMFRKTKRSPAPTQQSNFSKLLFVVSAISPALVKPLRSILEGLPMLYKALKAVPTVLSAFSNKR